MKLNLRGSKLSVRELKEGVDSILTLVDSTLSGYNKASVLSRFNRGEAVKTEGIFDDIYRQSREYYFLTGGAFDVACAPLFDAWGFGFSDESMPGPQAVDSLLAACGMKRLGETMPEPGEAVLNFNAIAQGYTCDLVAEWLRDQGIGDMLVDIGEIYCQGLNPRRQPWTVSVDSPFDGNNDPGAVSEGVWQGDGSGVGIVTSGNYRKFYVRDGRKFAHTIDPRTGWPVEHNLLSATITAPTAARADAFATAAMVMGLDAAKEMIESRPELEGLLIYDEGGLMQIWTSSSFRLRER